MGAGRLTPTQVDALRALSGINPAWRLAGGGALAGFYTRHRETRDLDLFWLSSELSAVEPQVERRLAAAGFAVETLQRAPMFVRLRVSRGSDVVVVDLVADPIPPVNGPEEQPVGGVRILVDSPHEILVSKLCALLSRSELRDLEDVRALLGSGGDLMRGMMDASRKDAGFSPPTLAWVLQQMPISAMGRALARPPDETRALEEFREELVKAILAAAKPG